MSTKQFTAQTFKFLHQVNGNSALPASDLKIALELTRYFNEAEGGRAYPSCKTIGDATGLSEATVIRGVRRMEQHGHLKVIWGRQGRGHPHQYWPVVKPAPVQVSEAGKPASAPPVKPASAKIKPAPMQENLSKNHVASATRNATMERESVLAHCVSDPGGAGPDGRAPDQEQEDFDRLWANWPRPFCDDVAAARRAYAEACREADPGDIAEAAIAWVAAADAPRFLPPLAKWLDARGWEKPPPQRRAIARRNLPRSNGNKVDCAEIAYQFGQPGAPRIRSSMGWGG